MLRPVFTGFLLLAVIFVSVALGADTLHKQDALAATKNWLAMIDGGEYAASWNEAAGYFKTAVTEEKWVQSLWAVRDPLGKLISRKIKSATFKTSLPGAPDGQYVDIHFSTSFENKKSATETVTPMMDKDGKWRASGYFIK